MNRQKLVDELSQGLPPKAKKSLEEIIGWYFEDKHLMHEEEFHQRISEFGLLIASLERERIVDPDSALSALVWGRIKDNVEDLLKKLLTP